MISRICELIFLKNPKTHRYRESIGGGGSAKWVKWVKRYKLPAFMVTTRVNNTLVHI